MSLIVAGRTSDGLTPTTHSLVRRMLCPLSGLTQTVGFVLRDPLAPKITIAGGELTGVHVLQGTHPPRVGAYHIGGSGFTYEESVIRTLGETIERYAHFVALRQGRINVLWRSSSEIRPTNRERVVAPPGLYSDAQLARRRFPFKRLDADVPIAWIEGRSLIDDEAVLVPAQQVLVGYVRRRDEPLFTTAVTTGSAAHTDPSQALRSALLELVQIDAAIGHWYGDPVPVELILDERTETVERALRRRLHRYGPAPRFFWLESPDLAGLAVACVLVGETVPAFAVGLGCDLRLDRAVYKAFLEAGAVAQLAKIVLFRSTFGDPDDLGEAQDANEFYDLDSNVGFYANGDSGAIQRNFFSGDRVPASALPPDSARTPADDVDLLVRAFRDTGKELVLFDLTTQDVEELGFRVVRVWSPDTLALPLPSAPPLLHPRFDAYGGARSEDPHPYP